MTDPYAPEYQASGNVTDVRREERMLFLRKTYSLVLLGIAIFAMTINAVPKFEGLENFTKTIWGSSPWIGIVVLLASAFAVRALARTPGIGLIGYLLYAFLLGTMLYWPISVSNPANVQTAALMTSIIFVGLTSYVFVTKKDFSFLGGILSIVLFSMIGIAVCGLIFGFGVGVWFSWLGAALFSGYILYDTSKVMRTHSSKEAVPAAIELFVDIVMLFWYILSILNSRD